MTVYGRRPILCLDFDGVIHDAREGWRDGEIYGPVTKGFFAWAQQAEPLFRLLVFCDLRSSDQKLRDVMISWMFARAKEAKSTVDFEFPYEKPPAFLTIDNRALTFDGNWLNFDPAKLKNFKSWQER